MLEYSANAATKDAFARAHAERGQMMRDVWNWLWSSHKAAAIKAVTA